MMHKPRIVRSVLLSAALCFLSGGTSYAQAPPKDFTIGSFIAGELGNARDAMQQLAAHKANWTQDIAQARHRFWAAYPNGAGLSAAAAELESLLRQKDLYYLNMNLADRISFRSARGGVASVIDRLSGDIDGGIRPEAREAFVQWANAVDSSATRRMMGAGMLTPEALEAPRSVAAHIAYANIRDLYEYLDGPHSPLLSSDPAQFLAAVMVKGMALTSWADGEQQYAAFVDAIGAPTAQQVASEIRPHANAQAWFATPTPFDRLVAFAGNLQRGKADDRTFALLLMSGIGNDPDWVESKNRYDDLVRRHGAQNVLRLAAALRNGGQLAYPCHDSVTLRCIDEALADGDRAVAAAVERGAVAAAQRAAVASLAVDTNVYWDSVAERHGINKTPWQKRHYIFTQRLKAIPEEYGLARTRQHLLHAFEFFNVPDDIRSIHPGWQRNEANDQSTRQLVIERMQELRELCTAAGDAKAPPCRMLRLAVESFPDIR